MTLSIVIPIFNEEENIDILYERLKISLDKLRIDYEIVFVDDGSQDNSLNLLKEIQQNDSKVILVAFRRNFGQTASFMVGFEAANGDVIVTMDGDLQNDPEDIQKLLNKINEGFDLVSGWRKNRQDTFINRKVPSMVANWLISKSTGVNLHDYGCSLKAYKKEIVKNIRLYGEMHRFIPAIASQIGAKIAEIETTHHLRIYGRSKYGISRTFRVVLDLIMVKFFQSFFMKPLRAFGSLGLASFLLGFFILAKLTLEKFFLGADIGGRPLLILGVLLIIVGIQLVGMGLLGEFLVRIYFESQKKPIYYIKYIYGQGLKSKEF